MPSSISTAINAGQETEELIRNVGYAERERSSHSCANKVPTTSFQEDNMETIGCVICERKAHADPVAIRESGWNGRKCPNCSLIYISPRPSLEEIITLYSHDSAERYAEHFRAGEAYRRHCARDAVRRLRRHIKAGDLLEIGAAHGVFCDEARKAGFTPCAIELNPLEAASIDSLGIPCERRPLQDAFPGKTFDVIYHCDVTSHFHDIVGEFRAMATRLRSGGVMMFEAGNYGDVDSSYYTLITDFKYPDHLFFLSRDSLRSLVKMSGFKVLSWSSYSLMPQLLIESVKNKLESGGQKAVRKPTKLNHGQSAHSWKRRLKSRLRFDLRYRLGKLLPSAHVPATQILVVQKISA
jgi:SAM-dependent methyltransferase